MMSIDKKDEFTSTIRLCACCGKGKVDSYEICDICGWQNDIVQNKDPDYKGGANKMSLNEAKIAYAEGKEIL